MHLMTRRMALALFACIAIAAPTAALASAGGAGSAAGSHTVVLQNLRFHPGTLTIKRGESVTWVWHDGNIAHNVTGPGFHSPTQSHGSFTVRFTHAGTFNYHCTIHVAMGMVGKIIVH
jgi:plastocyanin